MWGICEVEVQGTFGPFHVTLFLLNLFVLVRLNKNLQDLFLNIIDISSVIPHHYPVDDLSCYILQTCSRGSACNFIHCFRNPGGDYEWADSDRPPPKYWVEKMVALFGYSDAYQKQIMEDDTGQMKNTRMSMTDSRR